MVSSITFVNSQLLKCSEFNPCSNGACCSRFGICGNSADHCSPMLGCSSNCWPSNTQPGLSLPSNPSSMAAKISTRACGNGIVGTCADGRCCSQYGFCGSTVEFCAPVNACKSNCWTGNIALPPATLDEIENPRTDPRGLFSGCIDHGSIALTYDDGPGDFTGSLLDTLRSAGIKATFFVLGSQIDMNPIYAAFLKRAYDEGHLIASHTYSHTSLLTLSEADIIKEMSTTSDSIYRVLGVRPRIMRPPYGDCDDRVLDVLTTKLGYRVIIWNFDTLDWQDLNTDILISKVKNELTSNAVNVNIRSITTLMHDIHPTTVNAQSEIFSAVKASAFRAVRIDECIHCAFPYF